MSHLFYKEMKGVSFSCASPAAAAVCSSIDRRSIVQPTIDRRLRTKPLGHLPKPKASSSLDHRSSTARASTSTTDLTCPAANSSRYLLDESAGGGVQIQRPEFEPDTASLDLFERPNMYSSHLSISTSTPCRLLKPMKENETSSTLVRSAPSTARAHRSHVWAQSLVPIDSSKLLHASNGGNKPSSAALRQSNSSRSHHDQGALVPIDSPKLLQSLKGDKQSSAVLRPSNCTKSHHDQVVVLRVSLHCKGCEGKVRKHISKMEGVTSFSIDSASKKVTVKGDITPLGVLNSVSKVKNTQFWPSPPRASASASASF